MPRSMSYLSFLQTDTKERIDVVDKEEVALYSKLGKLEFQLEELKEGIGRLSSAPTTELVKDSLARITLLSAILNETSKKLEGFLPT